jgi:selenocysteine-specific elongation factor
MTDDDQLVKVKEDLYFYGTALAELKAKLVAHLAEKTEIDMPAFKDMTGLSRKFSVPLLEYFDRIKVTIRVGDKRILREQQK